MRRARKRCAKEQRRLGFVLLMTLALLTIASVLCAAIAQQSMLLGLRANQEIDAFRRRWAVASCRETMFALGQQRLLTRVSEGRDGKPVRVRLRDVVVRVRLSGVPYILRFADEQAKVDVNTLAVNMSTEALRVRLQRFMKGFDARLDLRPSPDSLDSGKRAYQSWGQVFRPITGGRLDAMEIDEMTREMTCWSSDGRLHLQVATDEAVSEIARLVLSPIETADLLVARESWDGQATESLIGSLDISSRKRELLNRLFSDGSESSSLWIHVGENGRREHYFFVAVEIGGGITRRHGFCW